MTIDQDFKVIRIPIATPTLWPNTESNCYLIGNHKETILVDAGYDQIETKLKLEKAIRENSLATPSSIFLTHAHPDHAPGVRQLAHFSPTIFCHPNEKEAIEDAILPIKDIKVVRDRQLIKVARVELEILHTPGHTSGHLSIFIPSEKILVAGDNIVSEGTTWIGPPDGDMSDYLHTLNRLKKLEIAKIGPGHGNWVLNPYEKIDYVINRRLRREEQILSLLKEHKQLTSQDLTKKIYKDQIHSSVFGVAEKTMKAHLQKLMKEGSVIQKDEAYLINY